MSDRSYYLSREWKRIRRRVLKDWDGFCVRCGEETRLPKVHHVVPLDDPFDGKLRLNPNRNVEDFNLCKGMVYLVLCGECHHSIEEWLKDPRDRLYPRVCRVCGQEILVGFDGEERMAFEPDGYSLHEHFRV